MAPLPDSFDGIVIVKVTVEGTLVTINFLSSKSEALKLELVIVLKLSNNIISPSPTLCALGNVIVTVGDPLLVLNAFVSVVVVLIGCMS